MTLKVRVLKVFYYPTKFSCHRHCDSGDIIVLVCHVISKNHVIKRLGDFLDRRPSKQVTIPPSLVALDTVVVKI